MQNKIKEENNDLWKNHASYANEVGVRSNAPLATLGDAVIALAVVEYLYNKDLPCDEISIEKSNLVSDEYLSIIAKEIGLDKELRLGKGAEKQGERENVRILEQIFEAYIGFKYLSEGLEQTRKLVINLLIKEGES